MATLKECFLASLDRMVGWEHGFGDTKSEHTQEFYVGWGTKMAIVGSDGRVRALGGSWWVVHRYDGSGKLLSRDRMRDTVKDGEYVVYGKKDAYEAYRNQPGGRS
jgi:hypothetical protein